MQSRGVLAGRHVPSSETFHGALAQQISLIVLSFFLPLLNLEWVGLAGQGRA
jgi:hypothetical protein